MLGGGRRARYDRLLFDLVREGKLLAKSVNDDIVGQRSTAFGQLRG
jgi:hypothetical protein